MKTPGSSTAEALCACCHLMQLSQTHFCLTPFTLVFQVKQIMEEAVTRKFVHADSSHIISFCGKRRRESEHERQAESEGCVFFVSVLADVCSSQAVVSYQLNLQSLLWKQKAGNLFLVFFSSLRMLKKKREVLNHLHFASSLDSCGCLKVD